MVSPMGGARVERLIILDTSVLVDYLRGSPAARDAMKDGARAGARLGASVLTKVEVLRGMRTAERSAVRRLFAVLDWAAVDGDIAELAGQFARRFRASHHNIEVPDYVIAATADRLGADLWTRNVTHFPMFPGLAPPY